MIDPNTQIRSVEPGPDDANLRMSARMADYEKSLLELRARVDELFLQFMQSKQREDELSRDIASASREQLADTIQRLVDRRRELAAKKLQAETTTALLFLDITDDDLQRQIEKARLELERANRVVATKSESIKSDSQKMEAIKLGKPEKEIKPILKSDWWRQRFDRIADILLIALMWAILQEWIVPLINAAFGKK